MAEIPLGNDTDIDDSQFYDRVNDISFLYNYLKTAGDASASAVLLTGVRGVGKTVLVKKLLRQFKNHYLRVYIDLKDCDPYNDGCITPLSFMKVFYKSIIKSCGESHHNLNLNNISESVFQKEEDYLKFACEMPGKIFDENKDILKGVLIFIDDFELIYQLDTDVLSFFRYLSHAQKGIAYVFSGNMDGV